jgi:hypothetical protein
MSGHSMSSADDVRTASRLCRATLEPHVERDWNVKAGDLEWDCHTTVGHVADALGFFAAHLGSRSTKWLKFDIVPHAEATNLHLLRLVDAMGELLTQVIDAASDDARAFHHSGLWDRTAFAAMGSLEALVHTGDVAMGLRIPFEAPRDMCRRVVQRLFQGAPPDEDPWRVLLWATGRADLAGRESLGADWGAYWMRVASGRRPHS